MSSSGIYSILPLGLRVMNNIINIIDEELGKRNALKLSLPLLHTRAIWKQTGRWEAMGTY
tara:strand:+ start:2051 stop:2230 length:180 start_codon:yes stop_codon:yes gene_type:complete